MTHAPRAVIRGANLQAPVSVSVDWLRFTLPGAFWKVAYSLLCEFYGYDEVEGRGAFNLPNGLTWGTAGLYFDRRNDGYHHVHEEKAATYCVVELPGSALALLPDAATWHLLAERLMKAGGICKRIDIACDWHNSAAKGLIQRMVKSARKGELTGARVFTPITTETVGGEVRGETVYFGLRGKNGSGRYVRVYEKGLETETADRGEWVRFEAELTQAVAPVVAAALIAAEDWASAAAEIAFGCIDFRKVVEGGALERRPRLAWWAKMLPAQGTVRIRARKEASTAAGYSRWITTAVMPVFAGVAAATGQAWAALADRLGWGGEVPSDLENRQVVRELVRFLEEARPGETVADWFDAACGRGELCGGPEAIFAKVA